MTVLRQIYDSFMKFLGPTLDKSTEIFLRQSDAWHDSSDDESVFLSDKADQEMK